MWGFQVPVPPAPSGGGGLSGIGVSPTIDELFPLCFNIDELPPYQDDAECRQAQENQRRLNEDRDQSRREWERRQEEIEREQKRWEQALWDEINKRSVEQRGYEEKMRAWIAGQQTPVQKSPKMGKNRIMKKPRGLGEIVVGAVGAKAKKMAIGFVLSKIEEKIFGDADED